MKKFTLMIAAALIAVVSFAQKAQFVQVSPLKALPTTERVSQLKVKSGIDRQSVATVRKAPRKAAELVTPPDVAIVEEYAVDQQNSQFLAYSSSSGWQAITSKVTSLNVAIANGEVYVQGLAYYFPTSWIKGTLSGNKITFPAMTFVGEDEYGVEYLAGSPDYGETASEFTFTYDSEAKTLTLDEGFLVFECDEDTSNGISAFTYWAALVLTAGAPELPTPVVAPEGLEFKEYAMSYTDYNKKPASSTAYVGIDADTVYIKGFSSYIPDALIKGVKNGNTIVFPGNQFLGSYAGYDSYFMVDATFTYDAEADTYSAEGDVYSLIGGNNIDVYATNPVLKGVVEVAAMPANPAITAVTNGNYGYYMAFNVPNVDVNGNGLVSSKLAYEIFTDVEGEVNPLTFTPATHTKLVEPMTIIPYGFTENYDFYDTQIYFNDLFSTSWNKLGIKSIYTGGGETNETEIQWFDIKPYAPTGTVTTFDFNALPATWPTSASGSNAGDITEATDSIVGGVTMTISPSTTQTPNRYWTTAAGVQLRMYGGTLTFSVAEDADPITKITFNNGKWNAENSADTGAFEGNVWTGSANTVVVTIAGNTQLNSIEVLQGVGGEDPGEGGELVTLPEGVTAEAWTLEGTYYTSQGSQAQQFATEVAFDGNDIYVKGLAFYFEDAWIKGTIDGATATFPTGQFVGEDEYGKEYLIGVDDDDNIIDIVFAYDAEAQKLTQQTAILENGEKNEVAAFGMWADVVLYAGEPEVLEPVVAPEGLTTEPYVFKATAVENGDDEETQQPFDYSAEVQVGFLADSLFIQGISGDCPELWVKAVKNAEGKYVIPANQYMGTWDVGGYGLFIMDYFFTAVDVETGALIDVVLDYNAETNTISSSQLLALNGSKISLDYYLLYQNATFTKLNEFAATPADPTAVNVKLFTTNDDGSVSYSSYPYFDYDVPAADAEGNMLLQNKMSYEFSIVDAADQQSVLTLDPALYTKITEPISEIPYTFTDEWDIYNYGGGEFRLYLNQGADVIASWKKIGVQSIYRGLGEEHRSNISWFSIEDLVNATTGISEVNAENRNVRYFDLQGRAVTGAQKGLLIKQSIDAQGNMKSVKVIRK